MNSGFGEECLWVRTFVCVCVLCNFVFCWRVSLWFSVWCVCLYVFACVFMSVSVSVWFYKYMHVYVSWHVRLNMLVLPWERSHTPCSCTFIWNQELILHAQSTTKWPFYKKWLFSFYFEPQEAEPRGSRSHHPPRCWRCRAWPPGAGIKLMKSDFYGTWSP